MKCEETRREWNVEKGRAQENASSTHDLQLVIELLVAMFNVLDVRPRHWHMRSFEARCIDRWLLSPILIRI